MATLADKIADGSIQHVVILMLENRSFDEYFGTFLGANGFYTMSAAQATQTFIGPSPQDPSNPASGVETQYLPARLSSFTRALGWPALAGCNHIWDGQHTAWANGAMNGWQQQFVSGLNNSAGCVGFYLQNDIPYHWALAQNFVLCDAYHCSVLGPTEPNRMYFFAGTCIDPSISPSSSAWPEATNISAFMGQFGAGAVTGPNYNQAPSPVPPGTANWAAPTFESYADFLTANGKSWKIYDLQGDGEPYDALVSGPAQLNFLAWFPMTWRTMFPGGYSSANSAHFVRDDNGDGGALAQFTSDVNNHSAATPFPGQSRGLSRNMRFPSTPPSSSGMTPFSSPTY